MRKFEPVTFGKYLLLERIGIGGMAEIFKAKTFGMSGFEKILVIKRILPKYGKDKEFREMFINEAKLTSALLHNNVIQIFDLGEIDGQYFIAMEYVKGIDLLHFLRKHSLKKILPPFEVIIFILKELYSGLGYAHAAKSIDGVHLNIVHRDVSPSNILLSYDGDIKISDFGIAKTTINKKINETVSQHFKGKLGYMSPEQVLGEKLDGRSDIFAAGIVAFELITMQKLFTGKTNLETLNSIVSNEKIDILKYRNVPRELAIVINKILEKKIDNRFYIAEHVVDALDEVAYRNNLRLTKTKFASYLKEFFKEEIQNEKDLGGTSYLYIPPKNRGDVSYIPRIDRDTNKIILESGRYVLSDIDDNYFINDGNGNIIGPMTLGKLSNLIKNGNIKGHEFFSKDNKNFKLAKFFPEIKALFTMHTSIKKEQAELLFSIDLSKKSFIKVLYELYQKKESGLLKLSNLDIKKEIVFKKGLPIFVKSNKESELFGNFLLRNKKITQEQLKNIIRNGNESKIGEVIIAQNILKPYEVFELLSEQIKVRLYDIFSWGKGKLEFYREYKNIDISIPLNIKFEELVVEGPRYMPNEIFDNIFSKRHYLKIVKNSDGFNVHKLKLNTNYLRVLNKLTYSETIGYNVSILSKEDTLRLYRLLYILLELNCIKFTK